MSQAPGFILSNVHVMAGVPAVFDAMLAQILPTLKGGAQMLAWSFRAGAPEGEMAEALGGVAKAHPGVSIGSYPFFRGGIGSTLVARAQDRAKLSAAADAIRDMLGRLGVKDVQETPPG